MGAFDPLIPFSFLVHVAGPLVFCTTGGPGERFCALGGNLPVSRSLTRHSSRNQPVRFDISSEINFHTWEGILYLTRGRGTHLIYFPSYICIWIEYENLNVYGLRGIKRFSFSNDGVWFPQNPEGKFLKSFVHERFPLHTIFKSACRAAFSSSFHRGLCSSILNF